MTPSGHSGIVTIAWDKASATARQGAFRAAYPSRAREQSSRFDHRNRRKLKPLVHSFLGEVVAAVSRLAAVSSSG